MKTDVVRRDIKFNVESSKEINNQDEPVIYYNASLK